MAKKDSMLEVKWEMGDGKAFDYGDFSSFPMTPAHKCDENLVC